MSLFKVETVQIDEVSAHPNAERLDLCRIKGWTCVSAKGNFKTGDLAIYIPLDSVLRPELVTKLGIEKMYHKRIKTAKLRGIVSQGLLAPLVFSLLVHIQVLVDQNDILLLEMMLPLS